MIGPLGRLRAAATLGQHCPQITQRRCNPNIRVNIIPEVRGWLEHINGSNFQADCFELSQQVEVHEVFMTEEAGTLPPSVNGGRLDDQLYLRQRTASVRFFGVGGHDK